MMVPNLTSTGSGGGIPGIPGKSVELQTTETAIQWRQTGGQWQDLVLLADITGNDGNPGDSVELRKTGTAIQWRAAPDGEWTDLVLLADLKGDPGNDFSVQYANSVVDLGPVRMAWGSADSILGTPESFVFPSEFAAPPVVQITKQSRGGVLVPQAVTKTGFVINRGDLLPSPIPFQWQATGLKPDPEFVPPARFDVPGLPIWSAAVRAQRGGRRNARALLVGDSVTAGAGANGASMVNNDKAASFPTQLAAILTARGSKGSWQSTIGTNKAASVPSYDNRWVVPASWAATSDATGATLGAYCLFTNGTVASATFTPTTAWDTIELYLVQRATSGTSGWRISVDGAEVGSVSNVYDNSSPGNVIKAVFTVNPGTHTVSLRSINEDWNFFCGAVVYNSSQKEVSLLNAGWSGAKAIDIANDIDRAYAPLSILPVYNPDLVVIAMGINDANQATPTARTVWMAQMQKIISASISSGADVLLVKPNDILTGDQPNLVKYDSYIDELATVNGLRVVDVKSRLGNYAAANAAGYMRDILHPNAAGYAQIATAIADVIMPVGA